MAEHIGHADAYETALKQAKEYGNNIIEFRTREKAAFDRWKSELLKNPDSELLKKIPYDVSSWEFEDLFSELYKDNPDPVVYQKQYDNMVEIADTVLGIVMEYNKRGLELQREALALQQKGMR